MPWKIRPTGALLAGSHLAVLASGPARAQDPGPTSGSDRAPALAPGARSGHVGHEQLAEPGQVASRTPPDPRADTPEHALRLVVEVFQGGHGAVGIARATVSGETVEES
jgi:hypothetical protein